jgi:CO dehydrogenase maturation factor
MKTIALAGKGGSGKTTISGLIINYLLKTGKKPVLAVDADPNSNLNEILGVKFDRTVVSTVDEIMEKKEELPAGITKERLLEFHLQDALIESSGFDLLVMGRTEGPGCYCRANDLLRGFMDKLRENYPYIVMDNEAGMEHLSRRTTRDVDILIIVANPTPVSFKSAGRIYEASQKLKLNVKRNYLIVNEIGGQEGISQGRKEAGMSLDLKVLGNIPCDEELLKASINGTSIFDLPETSVAMKAIDGLMQGLGI